MQEITLHEAAERAHQTEIICRLLEVYPNKMALLNKSNFC